LPWNCGRIIVLVLTTVCAVRVIISSSSTIEMSANGESSNNNKNNSNNDQSVFSLLVKLQFSAEQHKQTFLQAIQPVADHVKLHEPDTLSYEVLLSDKDPLHVLVLERYRNKDVAYLQIHKSSTPFTRFRPILQKLQQDGHVVVSGDSYLDAGVGFGDRVKS